MGGAPVILFSFAVPLILMIYWAYDVGWWRKGALRELGIFRRTLVWIFALPGLVTFGVFIAGVTFAVTAAAAAIAVGTSVAGSEMKRANDRETIASGVEEALRRRGV